MRNLIMYGGCKLAETWWRHSVCAHAGGFTGANWHRAVAELSGKKLYLVTSSLPHAALWTVGRNLHAAARKLRN